MNIEQQNKIQYLLKNQKITDKKLLSNSFNINCFKILTDQKKNYVVKYYEKKNNNFNAIKSETENLIFLNNKNFKLFPKVISSNDDILIMEYIKNNKKKPKKINKKDLENLLNIHSKTSMNYGFYFDTQIGGMKQPNNFDKNWANFFAEKRLNIVYEKISISNPMPQKINIDIENLLLKIQDRIPSSPKPTLLHGDLWEGNILFNDNKLVGLIDPGSFFGHKEMEIAYLRWFNPNFIDNNFLNKYNELYGLEKNYISYEAIYQLYYSLLNVHLWDRAYIHDVSKLLKKIKV